jgi:tetrapyrrole methylase family protein/MazG family protein
MSYESHLDSFAALVDVITKLRQPGGCPWDREQTHLSLKPYLVEECYEALEAIDLGDDDKLCEELGDIMMQLVLHARIGKEENKFSINDVLERINTKLIGRHPHVFGSATAKESKEVLLSWETLKREEKGTDSILAGLPGDMPALAYSQAIQRRAAGVGFDWRETEGILQKLSEEVEELRQSSSQQERVEEFGDLLFTLANMARRMDIELEESLRLANDRFRRRFQYMETKSSERGTPLSDLSLEEQNALWEEAKRESPTK